MLEFCLASKTCGGRQIRRGPLRWCRRFLHNYPAALALMAAGVLDASALITHVFPFDQAPEAFALTSACADGVLKASIEW